MNDGRPEGLPSSPLRPAPEISGKQAVDDAAGVLLQELAQLGVVQPKSDLLSFDRGNYLVGQLGLSATIPRRCGGPV